MIHDVEERRYLPGGGWSLRGVSKGITLSIGVFPSGVIAKFIAWHDWRLKGGSVRLRVGD